MSKRILDMDVATTLSGASFVVAKTDVNEQVPAGDLLTMLGFTVNGAPTNLGLLIDADGDFTISFKQADGLTDPSVANPILIAFRDFDKTEGSYNIRKISTGLSGTIPEGATFGQSDGVADNLYVYLIDVAGAVEPVFSGADLGDSGWLTSTTLDTTSDSATGVYSATPRVEVPFIKAARLLNTQATAGIWAVEPSEVWLAPFVEAESEFFKGLKTVASYSGFLDAAGFSAFTKDLIPIINASTFLTSLGVSDFAKTLLDDASAAELRDTIGAFGKVVTQAFSTSGTYTPNAKMLYCIIECIGGGGAGGGTTGAVGFYVAAGGGGSGGYARKVCTAADIGASKTVTIGAGGTGASGAVGGNGGDTSVGTLCIAKGGSGGEEATSVGAPGRGGLGGTAGTGDVAKVGNVGDKGMWSSVSTHYSPSGAGAPSHLAGGGRSIGPIGSSSQSGTAAGANTGAGGSGGLTYNHASNATGGAGGSGYVLITEICSS